MNVKQTIKQRDERGFTIIEVMIVLAIAALIMLIVFLAVPALKRTQRNTQRKTDVGAILNAVSDWSSNNNGSLPTASGQFTTEFTGENPNMSYYTTPANITWTYNTTVPGAGTADPKSVDNIVVVNGEVCSGNAAAVAGASLRSVIALYDIEISGGTGYSEQCVQG